jgi:glycosyltransferase involved in cell wall biosynthesis
MLLADPALRERLGKGARARVAQHYTWDLLISAAERAYNLALPSKLIPLSFE